MIYSAKATDRLLFKRTVSVGFSHLKFTDYLVGHGHQNINFKLLSLNARGIRSIEGSRFLIGCLNLLLIYVSFRKRVAPQKWRMNGKNSGKAKLSFTIDLIIVEAFLFLLKIS